MLKKVNRKYLILRACRDESSTNNLYRSKACQNVYNEQANRVACQYKGESGTYIVNHVGLKESSEYTKEWKNMRVG